MIHSAEVEKLVPMASKIAHEIHFFTGKGGVGKSTVAAAFALKEAQKGYKTLLVELGHTSYYQDFFAPETLAGQTIHAQPVTIGPSLDVVLWSGNSCLKEYVLHFLKVESLYRLFFENAVSKALINTAPSLQELAILGKITSHPRRVGPPLNYDRIVVDAFATGHFLALLRGPEGMAKAVRFGPMGEQTRGIISVLKNKDLCRYHVVSIPEELPIEEAMELSASIEELTSIKPKQILNRCLPDLPVESATSPFAEHLKKVKKVQDEGQLQFSNQKYEITKIYQSFQLTVQEKLTDLVKDFSK